MDTRGSLGLSPQTLRVSFDEKSFRAPPPRSTKLLPHQRTVLRPLSSCNRKSPVLPKLPISSAPGPEFAHTGWAKQSVSLFSSNFSKTISDTKKKLSHLKENCLTMDLCIPDTEVYGLTNYRVSSLGKSFHRTSVAIIILKNGICESLFLFARVLYLRVC